MQETGARLRREVRRGPCLGQQLPGRGVIEEFLVLWCAAPPPEEHFLGDYLMTLLGTRPGLFDHIAASEQHHGRLDRHLARANDGSASGTAFDARQRVGHDQLAELLDKAMVAAKVVVALRSRRMEADPDRFTCWQEVA